MLNKYSTLELSSAAIELASAYQKIALALSSVLGCHVVGVYSHAEAPSTLKGMRKAVFEDFVLPVSFEGGCRTLYGSRGNWWFRAMHDLGHVLYNKTVSSKDEKSLSIKLWRSLLRPVLKLSVTPQELDTCRALYFADTYGQTLYYELHSDFVPNQVDFLLGVLGRETVALPFLLDVQIDTLESVIRSN